MRLLRLLLLVLLVFIGILVYHSRDLEFFKDTSKTAVDAIDTSYHNYLNDVMKTSSIPLDGLPETTRSIAETDPTSNLDTTTQPAGTPYDPNGAKQIAMTRAKTICERVTSPDTSAFDNPEFNQFCGLSFDTNGKNSIDEPHTGGGLYIDPENKTYVPDSGIYIPTLGSSALFAINKESAEFMKKDLACKNTTVAIGTDSCSQCFSDGTLHALESAPKSTPSVLVFYTNATDVVFNYKPLLIGSKATSKSTANIISINGKNYTHITTYPLQLNEGDAITIQASHSDPTFGIVLAGYIQNQVPYNNKYNIDIRTLINQSNGSTVGGSINGFMQYNKFYKNTSIVLEGSIPFTFMPTGPDSQSCPNGPFITTLASANFIKTESPCYGPGVKPGAYSLACLQQLFLAAGGTPSGSGYPSDSKKAQALLFDSKNKPMTLSQIGQMLYMKNILASTGLVNGVSQTLNDWNDASVFLTGAPILNPCQTLIPGTPLSRDCLSYVYSKSRCTPKGTYNPDSKLNNPIPEGIQEAQNNGNAEAALAFYSKVYTTANNNGLHNTDRRSAFMGCYGVELKQ